MQILYGILCVLGTALPLSQFLPWLAEFGLDIPLLMTAIIDSPISAFAWLDVLVSAMVTLALIVAEGRRLEMQSLWIPVVALFTVGVSLGLPLFFLMRERHLFRAGRRSAESR